MNVEVEQPVSQQEEDDFINENLVYLSTFLDNLRPAMTTFHHGV